MLRAARFTLCVLGIVALFSAEAHAAVYVCDPAGGQASNPGTADAPWGALSEVASSGKLGKLQGGDTVLLRSGRHGSVSFGGENADFITIAAAPGQRPELARLEITQGRKWIVKGLAISPSFGEGYKGTIATLGERGESSELILEDCFIFSALDSSDWDVEKWKGANSGVNLGRHGKGLLAKNNYIFNTRFALNLCGYDCAAEANVICNFSADGIRMTRDGQRAEYNVIKNAFVSMGDGDANHDDGIQCFLFNKGTGTMRKLTVRGNIVINREDENQKYKNTMQAIGFFDGPLIDFLVEKNVVEVIHWHGVSLYDAQNCTIQDNACFTKWPDEHKARPWVMLGSKLGQSRGNTVKNNLAHTFNFKADPEVKAEGNEKITEEKFKARLSELEAEINAKYGKYHPVAKYARLGMEKGEAEAPAAGQASKAAEKAPAADPVIAVAAPVPVPEAIALSDTQLAPWQARLMACAKEAVSAGQQPVVFVKLFGAQAEKLKLAGADEREITLMVQGNRMPWAWTKLDRDDRYNVARGVLDEARAPTLAIAAVWAAAATKREQAEEWLAKARQVAKSDELALVDEAQAMLAPPR